MSPRLLDGLLAASLLTMTWAKINWQGGGVDLTISNITASAFIAVFLVDRLLRGNDAFPRAATPLGGFMLVFLAVYLAGYANLSTSAALVYWVKGIVTWTIHFLFLIAAVTHVVARGAGAYVRAVRWFVAGIAVNAAYGLLQLVLVIAAGVNLDRLVIQPLTAGQGKFGGINVYGQVNGGSNIYRINALSGDANHVGVILCVPLLLLLPVFLADPRRRMRLGLLLGFLFLVQVLTLSRSAALGDFVGLLVLSPLFVHKLPRLRTIVLVLGTPIAVVATLYAASPFVRTVIDARTNPSGTGTATHFEFYNLIQPALEPNPLFGMGFNTFAVYYEFITGKSNFGPHSYWVATIAETGMVGLVVALTYVTWLFLTAISMARSEAHMARLLGFGLVASLAGTAAANLFYLTMSFEYYFAVAMLVVAGQALFAPGRSPVRLRASPPAPASAH
jgi:O-antigen ligase/polysaccharide polymerase Wzy-like membrane protein